MEFVLYWLTTPKHFDIPRENPLKITDFYLYKLASITNYFLIRNGHCITSFSQWWATTSLEPIQVLCMLLQSMWVYMYLCTVMFGTHCFLRVVYHLCLFYLDPWALKAGIWQRHPTYEREPKCLVVGLPVNSHLLQKDISLMRVEWGTDFW